MGELVRFFYLVFFILPLALLSIGPLLVLAALRGVQRIGPIIFNPGQRGLGGRILALLLGLALWLVVWGGVGMLLTRVVVPRTAPTPVRVETLDATPDVTSTRLSVAPTPTPTTTPSPTPQPPVLPTVTSPGMSPAPSPSPSPTPSPLPPTRVPSTATPTATATSAPSPTPVATLSPDEAVQVIAAVEAANELLRAAAIQPSISNLAALETLWRGEALLSAQAFAQDLYQRYLRPLEVTFAYLIPPVALEGTSSDMAIVISTEAWTYTGPTASHDERFEFNYMLTRQGEGWVITDYTYGYVSTDLLGTGLDNLSVISPTLTITGTTAITSAGP